MASGSGQVAGVPTSGHHKASRGAWAAVWLIIIGFAVGTFALILHSIPLWIVAGAAVALGGILAVGSKIMEQAY